MELENLDPKQINALISLLSSMLPKEEEEQEISESVIKSKSVKAHKKGKKSVNLFDKMNVTNLHKDDSEIDKKLLNKVPSPRMRDFSLIRVICRKCGKTEEVNPMLVSDKTRYKCNQCSGTAG
jgi:hypothetical protein